MSQDNWKHRSTGMRCSTCMYHSEKKHPVGRCKRHAPTMAGFPVVFATDWCGEHKLDENKVMVSESNKKKFDDLANPPGQKEHLREVASMRNEHKEGDDALLSTFAHADISKEDVVRATNPDPVISIVCEGAEPGDIVKIDKNNTMLIEAKRTK